MQECTRKSVRKQGSYYPGAGLDSYGTSRPFGHIVRKLTIYLKSFSSPDERPPRSQGLVPLFLIHSVHKNAGRGSLAQRVSSSAVQVPLLATYSNSLETFVSRLAVCAGSGT